MLATDAGIAALAGWAAVVGRRVDGIYIAFDDDGWCLQMPELGGLSLETAVRAVGTIAAAAPVVGFGATALNFTGRGVAG